MKFEKKIGAYWRTYFKAATAIKDMHFILVVLAKKNLLSSFIVVYFIEWGQL